MRSAMCHRTAGGTEGAAGRAEDQTGDPVRVSTPHQLGNRAAHRVADGHERGEFQGICEGDDVVATVLEVEGPSGSDSPAVAAMVSATTRKCRASSA